MNYWLLQIFCQWLQFGPSSIVVRTESNPRIDEMKCVCIQCQMINVQLMNLVNWFGGRDQTKCRFFSFLEPTSWNESFIHRVDSFKTGFHGEKGEEEKKKQISGMLFSLCSVLMWNSSDDKIKEKNSKTKLMTVNRYIKNKRPVCECVSYFGWF